MRTVWFLLLGVAVFGASGAAAQAPAAFEERLAAKVAENRYAVTFRDGSFSGPGWERLLAEGRKSQFFLIGEEHGVAETPAVVRELFRALQPSGYRHLALEVSPPTARALDEAARGADGLQRLAKFYAENPPGFVFYTLKEEAELLAAARAAVTGPEPVLWGTDYEVLADRYLLEGVRRRVPEGPAKAAVEALYQKSAAAWKTVSETKNPAAFFSFSTPPEALADVRKAWPQPDPESARVLDVLETTLTINQYYGQGRGWESNDLRARFNRGNFLRAWQEAKAKGATPRVMLKFGSYHMVRGRTETEVFDLGSLAAELAVMEGSQAYHVLVIGGAGTQHAEFNPSTLQYDPAPVELAVEKFFQPFIAQALPEGFTLIDLRALRPLLSGERDQITDPELMRIVHGFDAVLILAGSHPSRMLP